MSGIFLSYRRSDSGTSVDRLDEFLRAKVGKDNVFRDIYSISYGADFSREILSYLERSSVILAFIGPRWLEELTSRIGESSDYVRVEIAAAFGMRKTVIPVLLQGATMPSPQLLPSDIAQLAYIHAITIRPDPDFKNDLLVLLTAISPFISLMLDVSTVSSKTIEYKQTTGRFVKSILGYVPLTRGEFEPVDPNSFTAILKDPVYYPAVLVDIIGICRAKAPSTTITGTGRSKRRGRSGIAGENSYKVELASNLFKVIVNVRYDAGSWSYYTKQSITGDITVSSNDSQTVISMIDEIAALFQ